VAEPLTAALPPELKDLQARWREARRHEQDLIYAREFAPRFLPLFARLPLHGWAGERPPARALISVLGLSWQPVALMAAWLKPEKLLCLGTEESLAMQVGEEPVLKVVARLAELPPHALQARTIQEPEELNLYREIKRFLEWERLGPREVVIDPTGGKKSMSAGATLAGFLIGAFLVYVDYAEYDAVRRIPVAGTEYPRLLHNPLEVFGDREVERILAALRHGGFAEAAHLAEGLAARVYEPREAEALKFLAQAYRDWQEFRFQEAEGGLRRLQDHLGRFGPLKDWSWAPRLAAALGEQGEVVATLARLTQRVCAGEKFSSLTEGLPLILNHLAAAERALEFGRPSTAILLTYATLERYVDLCLWVYYGLEDENPDYGKLTVDAAAYHQVGRALHGRSYQPRDLGGPLTLSVGVQLLATLKPELMPPEKEFLGRIKGLMSLRNRTEFEHGLCPQVVQADQVRQYLDKVKEIVARGGKKENLPELEQLLAPYRFPLSDLSV